MKACETAGVPTPVLRYDHTGLWVVFQFRKSAEGKPSVKPSVKILQLLGRNPEMTLAEVAAEIGKSVRAVELASSKLVKAGRLRYVGPQKGGHWEVL